MVTSCRFISADGAIEGEIMRLLSRVPFQWRLPLGGLMATVGVAAWGAAHADSPAYSLAEPVVALVPVIKQRAQELKLDARQQEEFAQWLKTAPAKRKAAEDQLAQTRLKLRDALLSGMGDTVERQALIADIGKQEAALVAMRAACVDRMRALLDARQFEQAVALYRASLQPKAQTTN